MRPEIEEYIQERRKEGYSDEQIKQKFLEHGYDKDVVEGFFAVKGAELPPPEEGGEEETGERKGPPRWLGWLLLIAFLVTLVLLVWQLELLPPDLLASLPLP